MPIMYDAGEMARNHREHAEGSRLEALRTTSSETGDMPPYPSEYLALAQSLLLNDTDLPAS